MAGPWDEYAAPAAAAQKPAQPDGPWANYTPTRTLNPEPPASDDGDFVRGFKRTLPEIKQLAGGTLAAAGDLVGAEGIRDYGLGVFQRGQKATEALSKPTDSATEAFQQVKEGNLGAGVDFLQNAAGYTAGQAVQSLAAAAAGAALGSEVPVAGNIAGAVGGLVAKGALKKAAIEAGEKVLAKQLEKGVAREAAQKAGSAATQKIIRGAGGAALGSAAYNTTMEVGSVYPEAMQQAEEEGRTMTGGEKARAVGSALAAAGVESVTDLFNLGAIFRGVKDVARDAGKQTTKQIIGAFAKRAAREAAAGAVREGSTEAVQTGLERFGARQSLNDADAWRDYIDSAAVGAVGGVLFGTAAATRPQHEQPSARRLNPEQPPPAPDFGQDPADKLRAAVLEAKTPKEFEKAHGALVDHLAKAGRLIEGPATVVGPDGTATLPADQAPSAPAVTGNAQISSPGVGLTPDVQSAQARHPGFPRPTLPDGSPLPSPANGPLSRAVNIAQRTGALAEAAEAQALASEAQAQVPLERDAKVKSRDDDVLPPPPANMDPETGELMPLLPEQMKAYLADQATRGSLPKSHAIASAFGINPRAASEMRRQVLIERRAQLEAEANDKKAGSNVATAGRTEPQGTAGVRSVDNGRGAGVPGTGQVDPVVAPDRGRPAETAAREAPRPDAGTDAGEGSLAGSLTYDESDELLDADIGAPSGGPFTIEDAAQRVAARTEGGRVFPVDGGFVVRTPRASTVESTTAGGKGPTPAAGLPQTGGLHVRMKGGKQTFPVTSLAEAQANFDQYREAGGEGARNTPPVDIVNDAGEVVAHFSYNGRLWKGDRSQQNPEEIIPEAAGARTVQGEVVGRAPAPWDTARALSAKAVGESVPVDDARWTKQDADTWTDGRSTVTTARLAGMVDQVPEAGAIEGKSGEFRRGADGRSELRQTDRAGRSFWVPAPTAPSSGGRTAQDLRAKPQGSSIPIDGVPWTRLADDDGNWSDGKQVLSSEDLARKLDPANDALEGEFARVPKAPPVLRTRVAQVDPKNLVTTRTLYGETVRVRQEDIDSDRELLPMYTTAGKLKTGKNGYIHRGNLDPDGSKARAKPGLSYYAHTTSKGEFPFKTEKAARAAVKRAGQPEDAYDIRPQGSGFIAVRKAKPAEPAQDLDTAAHAAATSPQNDLPAPTEAQKEAGNYTKGHHRIAGLDISIENPAGSRRRPEWPPLAHHYGYFRGTVGHDKDHVDVFLTDNAEDESRPVFVVDQVNKDGSFDEHKVIMGAASEAEARKAYLDNYSKGWTGLGAITQMTQDEFKAWVKDPAKTNRPAARKPGIHETTKADGAAAAASRINPQEEWAAVAEDLPDGEVAALAKKAGIGAGASVAEQRRLLAAADEAVVFPIYEQMADDGELPAEANPDTSQEEDWNYTVANFPAPERSVDANKAAGPVLTPAEAKQALSDWKAEARRIGQEEDHSNDVIISLFDATGEISKPWREAGYDVRQYDIKLGDDLVENFPMGDLLDMQDAGKRVVGVIAQPPCTCFTSSGARWWSQRHDTHDRNMVAKMFGHNASRYFSKPKEYTRALVALVDLVIGETSPVFWAMENPVGRIASEMGLPPATLKFDPHVYGNPYTKRTQLWGKFDTNLPTANVEPTQGSLMHKLWSTAEKSGGTRSITPEGFAYSFFMANRNWASQQAAPRPDAAAKPAPAAKAASPTPETSRPTPTGARAAQTTDGGFSPAAGYKAVGGRGSEWVRTEKLGTTTWQYNIRRLNGGDHVVRASARFDSGVTGAPSVELGSGLTAAQARDAVERHLAERRAAAGISARAAVPDARPAAAAAAPSQFASNTIFTEDKVAAARARLAAKLGTLNSGVDPEVLVDGMTIAGAYIESGVRSFGAYAKAMVDDFGDAVKPYLLSFYEAVRHYPGFDKQGMDTVDDAARAFDALITPADVKGDAIGNAKPPRKTRTKPTTDRGTRALRDDWGVDSINGYPVGHVGNTADGEPTKAAYLKDATGYLKAVAEDLEEKGYTVTLTGKGKPGKAVSTNEGGMAGSGEVTLHMLAPDGVTGIYAQIGDSALRGVVPMTTSGITLMYRTTDGTHAKSGANQWGRTDLTAAELAAELSAHVARNPWRADADRGGLPVRVLVNIVGKDGLTDAERAAGKTPLTDERLAPAPERGQNAGSEGASTNGRDQGSDRNRAGAVRGDQRQQPAQNPDDDAAPNLGERQPSEAARAGAEGRADPGAETPVPDGAARGGRDEAAQQPPDADRVPTGRGNPPDAVVPRADFTITDELDFSGVGPVAKFNNNLAAIRLVKQLEAEGRRATADEQVVLAKYVGWGGLPQAFRHPTSGKVAKGWEKRVAELEEALTPDEHAAAGRSTQDAHYTAANVVSAMWSAVARLGFDHGRVLEPSMGVGNFFGLMPKAMRAQSALTGVELDSITGQIAKQLYQTANVQVRGFNDIKIAPGSYDLAIGNPPFGAQSIHDPQYPEESKQSIHNYFFAKSIASVRPGGVLAMVVSSSFLDANTSSTRQWISERAKFLGAIRLPQTAFEANAGTAVTTDVVFLQRLHEGQESNPDAWVRVGSASDKGQAFALNRYFVSNPDMMLGNMVWSTHTTIGRAGAVLEAHKDADLSALLNDAIAKLPADVYERSGKTAKKVADEVKAADASMGAVKVYGFFVGADGTLQQRQPDLNGEQASTPVQVKDEGTEKRVRGMILVRDAARALLKAELGDAPEKEIADRRATLNKVYDAFVKANGMLSRDVNKRAFTDDPDSPLLLSLERDYDRGVSPTIAKKNGVEPRKESARKADIFSKRTNFPIKPVTDVSDAKSAMLASLNERGRIDFDFISGIYQGRDEQQIIDELGDLVYRTPAGAVEPADAYLSGNVKAKLAEAKKAAESDPAMRRNVEALEAVQPADVDAADIFVQIGTPWITPADYDQFARETFEGSVKGKYVAVLGRWTVQVSSSNMTLNNERWGTDRMGAAQIVDALLSNSPIVVKDKAGRDEPPVVNKTETAAAMGKATELQTAFVEWLWKDAGRRERLARYYNDTFNTDVRRKFDGAHMQFPGMQRGILTGGQLRPHQSAFAYRMVQDGVALADHVVGAGKTYASIAGLMEMRRLGLWRKPMVVVPNHLVDQWSTDFLRLYPGANILAAGRKDFEKSNRRKLFGRIATGDWDAVIVAHSSFGFIPVSPEAEAATLNQEQDEIEQALDAIREGAGKKDLSYKQLQKRKEALEEKLKRMSARSRDDLLTFEEMGVDAVVLDEAHEFKNLYFVTSQRNVAGLGSPEGSKKAFDLFVKTRVLAERGDGKNLVFLTGTPVSNTLSEVFHMQRYLQLHALRDRNVAMFDSWAGVFGQVVADWEMDAAGRFKEKTRFRKFANLPELVGIWRQVTDTVTRADLQRDAEAQGQRFPLPKIKGGRRRNLVVPRSPEQAAYIGEPRPRLDAEGKQVFDNETGEPLADYAEGSIIWRMDNMPKDPTVDNHLKATGDARKAGLDFRLIDPAAPDFPQSKINTAVAETLRIWKENDHRKGTQLIFCDLSVPASARGKATESAQARVPSWFIRRYGALQHVAGVKATLSAMPDHPFFTLKGKGEYAVHDAVSGERIAAGKLKQDAIDDANARLASDGASMRAEFLANAIPGEEIDAYIQSWQDAKDAKGEEEPEDAGPVVSMDELLADQSKFSVYDDIKAKLIAGGMPANQVAFIHDYNTDLQKADLFAKVNRGDIRVLLGSTQKMGAGMNVQSKLVALHHMDAPWRPSDLEQREGRILRQGNEFYNADPDGFEIELIGYATEQTYDAKQWEIIQTKAEGIETFKAGDPGVREIEDISSEAANAADMKGAASGNPLILESIKLRKEIKDLEAQERSHTRAQHTMQSLIRRVERADTYGHHNLKSAEKMAKLVDVDGPFALTIGSKKFADRKDVKIEPILAAFKRAIDGKTVVEAGGFRGAALLVDGRMPGTVTVALRAGEEGLGSTSFSADDNVTAPGFVTRLENIVSRLPHMVTDAQRQIAKAEREAEQAREELKRPFPGADALAAKRERSAKVVAALRSGKRAVDGDPVPAELKASRIDRSLTGPLAALKAGKGHKPLPTAQARAVAGAVVAKWKGGPRVTVLDTAPEGIGEDVEGWYDDRTGQVFLVAPHIKGGYDPVLKREVTTTERIRMVTVHEAIGHHGIEAITGPALWAELEQTLDRMRASGKHADLFRTIDRRYRGANRSIALREAIAVMAEKGVRNSVIDRVIAALRRFLREVAGLPMRFSEAELRQHIVAAARYVREGARPRDAVATTRTPGLQMSQRAGTFYSALLEAVTLGRGLPKKTGAAGWKAWLDGAQRRGEFKQSERDWLGLDTWLDGQGVVSRDEVADFIRANQVQVQDVMLGAAEARTAVLPEGWTVRNDRHADEPGQAWVVLNSEGQEMGFGPTRTEAIRDSEEYDPTAAGITKFASYTLPGGQNYRELLLTLPSDTPDRDSAPEYYRSTTNDFRSSHFDQPNILAHVRFNERTDAEGNRVLFLEEVQSDWHQAGRKNGYSSDFDEAQIKEEIDAAMESMTAEPYSAGGFVVKANGETLGVAYDAKTPGEAKREILRPRVERRTAEMRSRLTPDAPFKNTGEWAMLAFKRMVRYAAEHGFDRIAWTTGEQQAERYDLSKQVDSIIATPRDGKRRVAISMKGGNTIVVDVDSAGVIGNVSNHNAELAGKTLDEVVGKEMAERIMAVEERHEFTGDGLKIGGSGMRAFYDKILPSEVNKFAKRFGARTSPVRLANFEADFDFIEMEDATEKELAQLEGDGLVTVVQGVDITPAMRESALQGLPLFSKADPGAVVDDIEAIMASGNDKSLLGRAREFIADATPKKIKDQLRGTWLGALTTRHLTELGADYFENIKLYSDYLATMQADRNKLQTEGEGVAESARTWASKHREEAKRLFKLMHDATIEGVDPSKAFQLLQFRYGGQLRDATPKNVKEALKALRQQMRERSGDSKVDMMAEAKAIRGMPARDKRRKNAYPSLVARWNTLSPEAKQVFVQFRDMYAKRSDAVEAGLIARINDTDAPENHKRKMISVIRQQFETARLQGVYFPLQRFGRFFVAAEKEGVPTFLMFERLSQLERGVKDLRARGFTIKAQGLKQESAAKDAPSGTFVAEIITQLKKSGVSEKTQDEIYQIYLQALPELSMRKHSIHRQSVPGFDPDAIRAFAFNMTHGAHQLARLRYAHKLEDVLTLLKTQQDHARQEDGADTRKIAAGDAVIDELRKRHQWIMSPTDSQLTNLVSSAGFAYYLGLTPAAALVNLSQTALVSFPYLASRYGAGKAMGALLKGMRESAGTLGHIQKRLTSDEEIRAHQALQDMGALDKTQAHNLAGIAEGGLSGYNPKWAKAMEIIGWGFHKTEVINREATGMAAFRLARADGKGFEAAVRIAADAINDTHFDYTNANRARFMQSGAAKTLLMFRQYSLNMTWHLGRMVWQATKGQDPAVRKLARRNLAGVLGMTSLFAGTLGLPLMSVTMGALNAIAASFGDDDDPWDAETEFRAFLVSMLGRTAAETLLTGPVNALTGADVHSRVSLSDLWFRDADRELDGRGAYYHLLEQAAGPMGGVLKNALVGKQLMDEGHLMRGVETTMPKSLKDMIKAGRYATQGVNNLRGDPLIEDVGIRDTLLQLGGFTPADVASQYDENRALKNYEQFILDRRSRLMDGFAMALREGDGRDREKVLAKIRAFNKKNPELAISPKSLRASIQSRARYTAAADGGIVLNRKLAARLRERAGVE